MSDYSEHGAQPVEDAAVEHPPTVAEVAATQRRDHPEQVASPQDDPVDPSGGGGDDPDRGGEHPPGAGPTGRGDAEERGSP